jgi:hypothetical protein
MFLHVLLNKKWPMMWVYFTNEVIFRWENIIIRKVVL